MSAIGIATKVTSPTWATSADCEPCAFLECNGLRYSETMVHISYAFSVIHLWLQDDSPNPKKPQGTYSGRPAAGCLFIFSFCWPHAKLLLMHLFFYLPLGATSLRIDPWVHGARMALKERRPHGWLLPWCLSNFFQTVTARTNTSRKFE